MATKAGDHHHCPIKNEESGVVGSHTINGKLMPSECLKASMVIIEEVLFDIDLEIGR